MSSKAQEQPRLTVSKLQERVSTVFNSAQHSAGSHGTCCRDLYKLFLSVARSGSSTKFCKVFSSFLNKILVIFKREPAVERVVSFVVKFASTASKANDDAAADTSQGRAFVRYLITYLIDCSESLDKAVRFRSCQLLAGLIDVVPVLTAVSGSTPSSQSQTDSPDSSFQLRDLENALVLRLDDKVPQVRVEAAKGLLTIAGRDEASQDSQSEPSRSLTALFDALESDPDKDIRKTILSDLPVSAKSLPYIVHRTRDVNFEVRMAAYDALGAIATPQMLSASDRLSAISEGLKDKAQGIVNACVGMAMKWCRALRKNGSSSNDLLALLALLEVERAEEIAQDLLNNLFKDPLFMRAQVGSLRNLKLFENTASISSEAALLWRCLCEFAASHLSPGQADSILEALIPELTILTKSIIDTLHGGEPRPPADDVTSTVDIPSLDSRPPAHKRQIEFVLKQLLQVALSSADFRDEVGRSHIATLMRLLIPRNDITVGVRRLLIKVLARTQENATQFVELMTELIIDLHDDATSSDTGSSAWILCLTSLEELISITFKKANLQTLRGAFEENIVLGGVQHIDAKVRTEAISCLGLLCLQDIKIARKYRLLLSKIMENDVPSMKVAAMHVLFDSLSLHGVSALCREESPSGSSQAEQITSAPMDLISVLADFMNDADSVLRQCATEGVCKLLFLNRVPEPKQSLLFTRLIIELFNPLSERFTKVRLCIQSFFTSFVKVADRAELNPRLALLESVVGTSLSEVLSSRSSMATSRISLSDLCAFLFGLLRVSTVDSTDAQEEEKKELQLSVSEAELLLRLAESLLSVARRFPPMPRPLPQLVEVVRRNLLSEQQIQAMMPYKTQHARLIRPPAKRLRYLVFRLHQQYREHKAVAAPLKHLKKLLEQLDDTPLATIAEERRQQREVRVDLEQSIFDAESQAEIPASERDIDIFCRESGSQQQGGQAMLGVPPEIAPAAEDYGTQLPMEKAPTPRQRIDPAPPSILLDPKPLVSEEVASSLAAQRAFFDALDAEEVVPEVSESQTRRSKKREREQGKKSHEPEEFRPVLELPDVSEKVTKGVRVSVSPHARTKEVQKRLRGESDTAQSNQAVAKIEQIRLAIQQLQGLAPGDVIESLNKQLSELQTAVVVPTAAQNSKLAAKGGSKLTLELALFLAKTPQTDKKKGAPEKDDEHLKSPTAKRLKRAEIQLDATESEATNTKTSTRQKRGKPDAQIAANTEQAVGPDDAPVKRSTRASALSNVEKPKKRKTRAEDTAAQHRTPADAALAEMPPPPPLKKAKKAAASSGPKIVRSGKIGKSLLFGGVAGVQKKVSKKSDTYLIAAAAAGLDSDSEIEEEAKENGGRSQKDAPHPSEQQPLPVLRPPESTSKLSRPSVVAFTGFSDSIGSDYNLERRAMLEKQAAALGLKIAASENLDATVTHVVAPPGTRTLKTLAACLGLRWLLDPSWIEMSAAAGRLLPESVAGVRLTERPLLGKSVFISEQFKMHRAYNGDHFAVLIERLGKGKIVTSPFGADLILIGSTQEDQENYSMIAESKKLQWTQFFEMIQPPRPSNAT